MNPAAISFVAILVSTSLYAYHPAVEPDPAFLPFLLDSTCYFQRNSNMDEWISSDSRAYRYDAHGNLTQKIIYVWDSGLNFWIGNQKENWTYDGQGNLIEHTNYRSSGLDDWIQDEYNKYAYDENGNQFESVRYKWYSNIV